MAHARIVVVGAGVAGLTTALLLAKESRYQITVAAKHMPGDYDIEYASPWAGANYWPISEAGTEAAEWDETTWPELEDLARHHPEAGVHFQDTAIYNRTKDVDSKLGRYLAEKLKAEPSYKDVVPNFRQLSRERLGTQYSNGHAFTSVCINTAIYLPWLASQCLLKGVVFKRANLKHVRDASGIHHTGQKADLVVNCTGLSSLKLGGVEDQNMMPIRGQTVLVRNEANIMCSSSGTDDGEEEVCYLMQRAAGGGTLLGGSYQRGNWDSQLDPNLAIRIMKRAVELCPALTDGKGIEHLDIIRHGVGLRPYRQGGTRIEKERIDGVWTVHNYGHGGFGYQASYGCAKKAVKLVGEALRMGLSNTLIGSGIVLTPNAGVPIMDFVAASQQLLTICGNFRTDNFFAPYKCFPEHIDSAPYVALRCSAVIVHPIPMDHQFHTTRLLARDLAGTPELLSLWEFANSTFAHGAQQYPEMGVSEGKRFEQPADFTEEMGTDGVTFIHYVSSSREDSGKAKIVATAGCKPWSNAYKLDERVKRMREEREAREKEPAQSPGQDYDGFYTKEHEDQLLKQIEKLQLMNDSKEQDGVARWEVMTVCVHPEWQKKGLADRLLEKVAGEVSSQVKSLGQGPEFKLMVRTMKEINEKYWLSKGFKPVGEIFFEPGTFGSPTGFHIIDLSRDHRTK